LVYLTENFFQIEYQLIKKGVQGFYKTKYFENQNINNCF